MAQMNSVMDRLKAISHKLRDDYRADRVVLYGSCARGEATAGSDVDLLIVVRETTEPFYARSAAVKKLIRPLRDGLVVAPIVLTAAEIKAGLNRGNAFLRLILETGIEL